MSEKIVKKKADREFRVMKKKKIEHRRASKTKYMVNKSWFCDICNNNKDYKLAG